MAARRRLIDAVRLARYRAEHHASTEWVTFPEGSARRSKMLPTVAIPLDDLNSLIKAATRELTRKA